MHIPLAFGLVGPDGEDIEPTRRRRRRRRGRRHPSAQAPPCRDAFPASPSGRRCRSTAASPRRSRCRSSRRPRRPALPRPPRQRPVLALAGLQHLLTEALIARLPQGARRRAAEFPRRACRTRRRASPPTRRWSLPTAPWRWRCPARPTSPARSAATSIPTRSTQAREALVARDRRGEWRGLRAPLSQPRRTRRLQPRCGERRTPRAAQRAARLSLAAAGGGASAAVRHFADGHQHDRPRRGADRAGAPPSRHATRPSEALAAFETRYRRRRRWCIDKWFQIQATVPGAGTLDAVRGADRPSRLLDRPIPTACAR